MQIYIEINKAVFCINFKNAYELFQTKNNVINTKYTLIHLFLSIYLSIYLYLYY